MEIEDKDGNLTEDGERLNEIVHRGLAVASDLKDFDDEVWFPGIKYLEDPKSEEVSQYAAMRRVADAIVKIEDTSFDDPVKVVRQDVVILLSYLFSMQEV